MKINNETQIGLLVVAVAIILAAITWKAGDYDFTPHGYYLKVRFKNIDNVELNAPVTVNGFEVGRVEDIQIIYEKDANVELTLWIDEKAKIRKGAQAFVKNLGFMGEKYIGITSGDATNEYLPADSVIQGEDPGSFEKLLAEGQIIAKNVKEISISLNERMKINSEKIDDIIENMKVSMKSIKSASANVDERLDKNKQKLDDIVANLDAASRNLEDLSYDLKMNPWKLMYKEPKKIEPDRE